MYAVIRTGGKQYRVQPGDVLVVEKLDAEVGAAVTFGEVLMVGDGEGATTVGAPLVEGATVTATLIETRKGEKVKVFKKIRRQGYRRTKGHRQPESVLRVTALDGAGASAKWDGTVDMTTRAELVARARGLAPRVNAPDSANLPEGTPTAETPASETVATPEAAAKPARTRKAAAASPAMVEQPVSEAPAAAPETSVDADAASETGSMAAAEEAAASKKTRAPRKPKAAASDTDAGDQGGEA
ncbi:MAG: 50S ribosomal protein L21 [Caulobacteraceae bacterium]|nr:50S ribosomal protein L21 [Caulobacter sp.]